MEPVQLAAILAAVVVVASMVSVELGVTVALIELTLGVFVGNVFDLGSADWLVFVAKFGSIVLTFLAGMEVDPDYMEAPPLGLARDRLRVVRGSLRRLVARRLLPDRLDPEGLADRGHGALDHLARRRL